MPPAHHVGQTGSGSRRPNRAGGAVAAPSDDRSARLSIASTVTQPSTTRPAPTPSGWVVLLGLLGLLVTLGAVVLEVVAGTYANSSVPRWAAFVPLVWPQPLRVLWWLVVVGAVWSFRWSLRQLGLRSNRLMTVLTVAPFLLFAAGIAVGADWATWH